jgi:hypothetical protein
MPVPPDKSSVLPSFIVCGVPVSAEAVKADIVPAAAVDAIVIAPFDADAMVILSPAVRYEVPSTSRVSEPDKPNDAVTTPEEKRFGTLTSPVNVVPETVATTESFMLSVYVESAGGC